jgi:hypothetical protein
MITILFWNIRKKSLHGLLQLLVGAHNPDIIILAECPHPVMQFVADMNAGQAVVYRLYVSNTQNIVVLTRLPSANFKVVPLRNDWLPALNGRVAFYEVVPIIGIEMLLVGLHLPSKMHLTSFMQLQLATRLRPILEAIEDSIGHRRTVVIGDFNMDPFETGLTSSETFQAVMDRQLIVRKGGNRQVAGAERRFFYNPMWSLLGDESAGPPGTYFYEPGPEAYYWHTFDQVLIRPDLLAGFSAGSVNVLTAAATTSLLTKAGLPDKKNFSDHLPLLVKI